MVKLITSDEDILQDEIQLSEENIVFEEKGIEFPEHDNIHAEEVIEFSEPGQQPTVTSESQLELVVGMLDVYFNKVLKYHFIVLIKSILNNGMHPK